LEKAKVATKNTALMLTKPKDILFIILSRLK
jgi:hypothetical protein